MLKRALNFQESMEETARFSKYLFTAPEPYITIPIIFFLSFLLAYAFFYPDNNTPLYALTIFFFPALLTGLLTKILVEIAGAKMYLRRSFLLVLLSLLLPLLFALLARALSIFIPINMNAALCLGIASIAFFRHFVSYAIAKPSHLLSAILSSLHVVLSAFPIFLLLPSISWQIFGLSTAFFILSSILFIETVSFPMKRFFGVKGAALVKPILEHLTAKTAASASEIEAFLSSISANVNVEVGVLGFRSEKSNLLVVVPAVHPGPFSMIGGGDLPRKMRRAIRNWENVMVPHGPATHDFNLCSTEEAKKVARFAEKLAEEITFSDSGSEFVRVNKNGFSVGAQFFGNCVFVVATSAPEPTDDIDYPTGLCAMSVAEKHAEKVVLADAHNCYVKGSGAVRLGMERAEVLLENVELAVSLAKKRLGRIRFGYAESRKFGLEEGIGPCGIQVLCVECNGKRNAYVLIDGNNMVQGLRERILAQLKGIVDDAEIMTSDNHIVNATFGGFNPVGKRIGYERLCNEIKEVVSEAIKNLSEAEVGGNRGKIKGLRVFGHETAPRLTTVMNTTYIMLWPLLSAFFLLPSLLSLLLYLLL